MSMKMKWAVGLVAVGLMTSFGVVSAHAQSETPAAAPAAEAKANTPEEEHAIDLTKKIYLQLVSGTVDRSLLTKEMDKTLAPEAVADLAPQLKALGEPQSFTLVESTPMQDGTGYKVKVKFAESEHEIDIFIDGKGLVGGYLIRP